MKLVGFNFSKIQAEKSNKKIEDIQVSSNIDISEITEMETSFFKTKDRLIGIKFSYLINYSQDYAKIVLEGNLALSVDSKIARDLIRDWKDKKIPEDIKPTLFNLILRKSNVKALRLEEDLALPFHFPMPSIKPLKKDFKPSD